MTPASLDPEGQLLRRATRQIALRTAAAVVVVVLAMIGAVLALDERQQRVQADQVSRSAWESADDVLDAPVGTWLIVAPPAGPRQVTAGAPSAVAAIDPGALAAGSTRLVLGGRKLVIWTGDRRIGRVSAVYDLSPRELEERRLQLSLTVAGLVGVAGAAVVGALIGRRAVRPLGAAIALQRRFVADASHELRTPLSVLLLRLQLLRRHLAGSVTPDRERELDRLVRDTEALGDVVSDLLLSAELEHRPQRGRPIDLVALARDVVAGLQPLADQHRVQLSGPAEPEGAGVAQAAARVNGVDAALRRALGSLVDNAFAHTPAGGNVRVQVAVDSSHATLTVADDGEGLDPASVRRMVERFSRGTSAGSGRRFGLGLALVDEVARAHGGALVIDGAPGDYASFSLRLPRIVGTDG